MQEILLAIHVKRGTWDKSKPVGPWITSIVSYKLSGMLRARRDFPMRHLLSPLLSATKDCAFGQNCLCQSTGQIAAD